MWVDVQQTHEQLLALTCENTHKAVKWIVWTYGTCFGAMLQRKPPTPQFFEPHSAASGRWPFNLTLSRRTDGRVFGLQSTKVFHFVPSATALLRWAPVRMPKKIWQIVSFKEKNEGVYLHKRRYDIIASDEMFATFFIDHIWIEKCSIIM